MVAENILRDVLALSVLERVALYERLQRNIEDDLAAMPIPEWHAEELARRLADDDANPDDGYSLEEVETMLAAARRKK